MSDQIGRLLEEQYGMARNRLGDFSATSPLNRESGNVIDGRARANEPWLKRTVEQLASDVDVWRDYLKRSVEARGQPPVSMQEISALLPTQEIGPMVPGSAAHKVPFPPKRTERLAEQPPADGGYLRYLATMPPRRADGGSVDAILSQGPEPTGRDKVFDTVYGWLGGKPENRWAADKISDVATLGGMAPWAGAYEGARELAQTGRPAALATAVLPGARVAAPAAKAAGEVAKKGIRAFHGSPHDFDRFSLDKIGTGEGAQAYGHGLYFAENEGVAKGYRNALSKARYSEPAILADGKPVKAAYDLPSDAEYYYAAYLQEARGDVEQAVGRLVEDANRELKSTVDPVTKTVFEPSSAEVKMKADLLDAVSQIDELKRRITIDPSTTGRMYEVNIKADPNDFLDWDKPLSQQSEKARAVLEPKLADDYYDPNAPVGQILQTELLGHGGVHPLREAGIPGIRYLDQGSRGAGEGSRNYVVFDDKIIDIVRKYGIAGLLAAAYGASSDAEAAPARADGGGVSDVLSRAWDARPWKDYATNPPSMAPQIGIALGLLNPTLGRSTRDMSMARGASTPAMAQPPKEASASVSAPPSVQPGLPMWQLRENYARGPANSNKPLSNVERYEAYLSRMYDQGAEPVTFRSFLRGIE